MAVKASGQITLSSVVDVYATYRYYLLQSSTAAAPSKPTTFPPSSAWKDAEPGYTEGSTNSLYIVDCSVFSDGTFAYSLVSLSSSYEAAKAAYNKATNALQHTVVQSTTAPSITTYMWLDISVEPPILKRYNAETASWVIVNDTTEIIYNLEQNLEASITKSAQDITLAVSEDYYLKDETDSLISSVGTLIEQTKNSVEIQFNQFSADIEAVANGADAEFEEIRKYIRFEDGKIMLGETGNELELVIANNRISFLQDGAEVAYFSNRKLYVTDGEYTHSLRVGRLSITPRSNGNTSINIVT
ncbi:MAG: hypothetical protein IKY90_07160 [Oscillospiraceae bacterium]|nr:hypothetical protein [Oscillospiraceae bacterium]